MKTVAFLHTRLNRSLSVMIVLVCMVVLGLGQATAAPLTNRSIAIETALTNAITAHTYRYDYVSNNAVGSVAFIYCDNSPLPTDPCNAPAGLNVAGVNLASQSGQTGFSLDNADTTSNRIVISRPPLSVIPGPASYSFNNAINASTPNKTIFVRIGTFASNDGSGSSIDQGAVAFTLSSALAVNAFVPPFLALCAGVTVAINCSSSNGLGIDLGTLLATQANTGTTQVAAATNDANGYLLSMQGTTMTSGNNTLPALANPTISSPGTGQFGINLRNNSSPSIGHEPDGSGSAIPTTDYNQPNLFTFRNGDAIAGASQSTDFNRFTISYLVNIPFGQAPGVYSTTITYIATASF